MPANSFYLQAYNETSSQKYRSKSQSISKPSSQSTSGVLSRVANATPKNRNLQKKTVGKEKIVQLIAYGYDVDDPDFYYIEKHKQIWINNQLQTSQIHIYDTENRLFVLRRMNFQTYLFHPDYWLQDYRTGQQKSIQNLSANKTKFSYLLAKGRTVQKKTRNTPKNAIIYDGINVYVAKYYQELIKLQRRNNQTEKKSKTNAAKKPAANDDDDANSNSNANDDDSVAKLAFADAKYQFYIDLELIFQKEILYTSQMGAKHPNKKPEHTKFKPVPAYLFHLVAQNAFIRSIAPRIRFIIAKKDTRLLQYEGPTPFNNRKNQKNFTTITEYHLIPSK